MTSQISPVLAITCVFMIFNLSHLKMSLIQDGLLSISSDVASVHESAASDEPGGNTGSEDHIFAGF